MPTSGSIIIAAGQAVRLLDIGVGVTVLETIRPYPPRLTRTISVATEDPEVLGPSLVLTGAGPNLGRLVNVYSRSLQFVKLLLVDL